VRFTERSRCSGESEWPRAARTGSDRQPNPEAAGYVGAQRSGIHGFFTPTR